MAHVIDPETCISCGVCADACPSEAISEGDDAYIIDASLCNDCDACSSECPSEAISVGE